jgi:hypothetical protein
MLSTGELVPCGKCMACRINRTRQWAVRLYLESFYWKRSLFVTLTYDNDHLVTSSLCKTDLQKFFKRLRRDLEKDDRNIKYFACGEYGPETQRPHYHAIIFGLDCEKDQDLVKENWPFGFITVGTVTYESCRYTAQYIQKKVIGVKAEEEYKDREPPFQIQSQGLGLQYALDYLKVYKGKITVDGKVFPVPRYFRDKVGMKIPDSYYDEMVKKTDQFYHGHNLELDAYLKVELAGRSQNARNLASKFNRRKDSKI